MKRMLRRWKPCLHERNPTPRPPLRAEARRAGGVEVEGNPLTLEQVRALEEGRELVASDTRSSREVLNYFAGLRYVEKHAKKTGRYSLKHP